MIPGGGAVIRPAGSGDHRAIVAAVDDWWGRRIHDLLPRLWFDHFSGTSFVAEGDRGAPIGFVTGFISPDRPGEAYLHLVGVAPSRRRRGIGRALVARFGAAAIARDAKRATTIAWPGERIPIAFLLALGFTIEERPGSRPIYGIPAMTGWNHADDDQVVLTREF